MTDLLKEHGDDVTDTHEQDATPDKPAQQVADDVAPKKDEEKPEVKAEAKPDDKYENVRAALREERESRRVAERQLQEAAARISELAKIKEELDNHRNTRQQEALEKELQENPAAVLWRQQQELNQKLNSITEKSDQQRADDEQVRTFVSTVAAQTSAYAKENPGYQKAYEFARERRLAEYEALGIPREQQEAYFTQESMRLAYAAMQQGKNPGELVWSLAQTWGFKPAKEEKKPGAEGRLEKIAEGLEKAAGTLSKGTSQDDVSVLKKWEEMDEDELDKAWKQMAKEAKAA